MATYHIHIKGQVQGVGFRPYVYRLATARGLRGSVSNDMDGVHIYINAEAGEADAFYHQLLSSAPPLARVLGHTLEPVADRDFRDFAIAPSSHQGEARLLLTPDLGLCPDCKSELHDPANRRFGYAFNSCINCGPRYSIIRRLPYDRDRTTMADFLMCPTCQSEYDSPLTRRHFSQTNSCPDCGVEMAFLVSDESGWRRIATESESVVSLTCDRLENGDIIAVKGIGGYLLVCDAGRAEAIAELRARKHRPSKPFALMYPDIASLRRDAWVSDRAAAAFLSIESPIVLCPLLSRPGNCIAAEAIAPGLRQIGAMQPYTPLFELILSRFGKPVVATSGNISGSPIFYEDEAALEQLGGLVDAFLVHNRPIVVPQDDSVVRFTPVSQERIILRRSRGLAPTFLHQNFSHWPHTSVLAMGADLKSAFALHQAGNSYVSQYLGNLENYDAQQQYRHTLSHLLTLFDARPEWVLVDRHPAYHASELGRRLASEWRAPVLDIQHHVAHFAAVLGEHALLRSNRPILGVIWDGTGWGEKEHGRKPAIWGGEFFRFADRQFQRVDHLDYFPHLLGDKLAKEPRLSALALCHDLPAARPFLRPLFTETEWTLYRKMIARGGDFITSSVGRLFDGVAALLGLAPVSSFEGEAAMQLETLAMHCRKTARDFSTPDAINRSVILHELLADLIAGREKADIAFRFHLLLVRWIEQVARRQGVAELAFSGGVFQNALLHDLIRQELGDAFTLYFHQALSPNDECIAFGQLCYAYLMREGSLGEEGMDISEIDSGFVGRLTV